MMIRSRPWLLIGALALALAGCAASSGTRTLGPALAAYSAGNYRQAQEQAAALMRRSSGTTSDQAAYLTGLCAYRLKHLQEAERPLQVAAASRDETLAAKARATLGLVRLEQDRPADAETYFQQAAGTLDGEDGAQAAYHAELAGRLAGHVNRVAFTLQVGAFQERKHAEQAKAQAAKDSRRGGLGSVRIVPGQDDRGRHLYYVQFGRFGSRDEAASARSRLGRLEYIVAPMARTTN